MRYGHAVVNVFHLGLAEIFLHVVSVKGLAEPAVLESIQHLEFLESIRYGGNCLLESH